MTERIHKLYKSVELVAAQKALVETALQIDHHKANRILVELHKLGFRVVYVGKIEE